jgi:four helix bundle protein
LHVLLNRIRKDGIQIISSAKLTDADMENGETQSWLDASLACGYITNEKFTDLNNQAEEVSRILNYMINNPDKFK